MGNVIIPASGIVHLRNDGTGTDDTALTQGMQEAVARLSGGKTA